MSLDKFSGKWTADKKAKFETNAFYEDDGEKNMKAIESYLNESGNTWELFPYYEWCRSKGKGWYAPSLEEMNIIIEAVNGCVGNYDQVAFKKADATIKSNGGDSLYGSVEFPMGGKVPLSMMTSTETNSGKMFMAAFFPKSPFSAPIAATYEVKKTFNKNMGSRAVYKF